MIIDTTVKALKNLCAVLLGDDSTWEDIPGTTIPEVINQIAIAKGGEDPSGRTWYTDSFDRTGYYFRQNKSNRIWQ